MGIILIFLIFGVGYGLIYAVEKYFFSDSEIQSGSLNSPVLSCSENLHQNRFFDRDLFFRTQDERPPRQYDPKTIGGVIIPHHLLAGRVIAGTLGVIASPDIKTVFVMGPDHYKKGTSFFTTSLYRWDTPWGVVDCHANNITSLLLTSFVTNIPQVLEEEHSISGIMPYVQYFFPNARVIPLSVRSDTEATALEEMSRMLGEVLERDKSAILIASVDFSHYLSSREAIKKDKQSLEIMQNRTYTTMRSLEDDHMDSPETIEIFLRATEIAGFSNLNILYNTNSGILTGNPFEKTTSYFGIVASTSYEE